MRKLNVFSIYIASLLLLSVPAESKVGALLKAQTNVRTPLTIVGCTANLYYTPCERAYDNNYGTAWISNQNDGFIELDLGSVKSFSKIDLKVTQSPDGWTNHYIYVGNSTNPSTEIMHRNDYTHDEDLITWRSNTVVNARYVRVVTTSSPSWVAWLEIKIYP